MKPQLRSSSRVLVIVLFALVCPIYSNNFTYARITQSETQAERVLVDDNSQGYYNEALGTLLDGTQPQFPPANNSGGDPTIFPAAEPNLAAASQALGAWLFPNPLPLNSNWSSIRAIPKSWTVNTESAIIYPIDTGTEGISNVKGNFGVDNGIFVWVNGVYKFGALAPGAVNGFEYVDIDLGDLPAGMNYIQVLREDHSDFGGYTVRITGSNATPTIFTGLVWQRSRESETINGRSIGAKIDDGLKLPTFSDVVWDNGLNTPSINRNTVPIGYQWASWTQKHTVDLRRFKATFSLPEGLDPATAVGTLFDPYYADDILPINDNIYVYVNGVQQFIGGSSYSNIASGGFAGTSLLANETDGWYVSNGITLNGFRLGINVIDIVTEEYRLWGGLGYLALRFGPRSDFPEGRITQPAIDNTSIGAATLVVTADAWAKNNKTVKQVEFWSFYDGIWHSAGIDQTSPYQIGWHIPNKLRSQQIRFRIDVLDSADKKAPFAGGVRTINYFEPLINPSISENWIPFRAYLNQRSLADGDSKCSAASMSMVLADIGLFSFDYTVMANKANEMYPNNLAKNGKGELVAWIWKMNKELTRQGSISEYLKEPKGVTNAEGWNILKQEIDSGRPVIIRTIQGVLTLPGHIIVVVGYREEDSYHEIIVYDPYGKWKGKTCSELGVGCKDNYDKNDPVSDSIKGLWVRYDFDKVFGSWVITARRPANMKSPARSNVDIPSSPPDAISDERENVGSYLGVTVEGGLPSHYLPLIMR